MSQEELDLALTASARDLYWQFLKLKVIHQKTGLPIEKLRRLIYGKSPQDPDSWLNQRRRSFAEDFIEEGERNVVAAHSFASRAIDLALRSIEQRALKTYKRGDRAGQLVPLTPFEVDATMAAIIKIDKLTRLTMGQKVLDDPEGDEATAPPSTPTGEPPQVIDMQKLMRALRKDKSVTKLLLQQKEQDGNDSSNQGSEEVHRRDGSADAKMGDRPNPETTITVQPNRKSDRVDPATIETIQRTAGELQRPADSERVDKGRHDERTGGGRVGSAESTETNPPAGQLHSEITKETDRRDSLAVGTPGEGGAGERDFARVPEDGFGDPFEDEYS